MNLYLQVAACETRHMTIVDDFVDLLSCLVSLILERTPGLDIRITLDPVDGVVEIIDDDGMYM